MDDSRARSLRPVTVYNRLVSANFGQAASPLNSDTQRGCCCVSFCTAHVKWLASYRLSVPCVRAKTNIYSTLTMPIEAGMMLWI